jgi:hypothetical protein
MDLAPKKLTMASRHEPYDQLPQPGGHLCARARHALLDMKRSRAFNCARAEKFLVLQGVKNMNTNERNAIAAKGPSAEVSEGKERLRLSVSRMKKVRSGVVAGLETEPGTAGQAW